MRLAITMLHLAWRFLQSNIVAGHLSANTSWNRIPESGYKVIFVPFANGQPNGKPVDVLTGFLSKDDEALGRPVGVIIDRTGALLVADDVGNTVWRVTSAGRPSN
jgi:glucose/arabinose dehydrogenase